jgi:hypothetical protein
MPDAIEGCDPVVTTRHGLTIDDAGPRALLLAPGGSFIYESDNRATFRPQQPNVSVKVVLACIPK